MRILLERVILDGKVFVFIEDIDLMVDVFSSVMVVFSDYNDVDVSFFVVVDGLRDFFMRRIKYINEVEKSYILFKGGVLFGGFGVFQDRIFGNIVNVGESDNMEIMVVIFNYFSYKEVGEFVGYGNVFVISISESVRVMVDD